MNSSNLFKPIGYSGLRHFSPKLEHFFYVVLFCDKGCEVHREIKSTKTGYFDYLNAAKVNRKLQKKTLTNRTIGKRWDGSKMLYEAKTKRLFRSVIR